MSSNLPDENQTTIALSGGGTVPIGSGYPLPGEHSNLLPVGTRLGEFELTGLVGEGGFGIVYLAYDHSLHRQVAVKEYIPASLANRGPNNAVAVISDQHLEPFRAGLNSFINEARLLAQFDHPSLLKVYRFWEANGTAYMAMPYYEGITLRKAVKNLGGPPDEEWLKHLLRPLLDALSVMHDAQCYHRDIAPDNILILGNGRPVLLDFGAARRVIADMTQAPTVILKPGYAPVEQYGEDPTMRQGPWTDVYALAAVIYSAIVGKAPQASISRYMSDGLKPLASVVAGRYSDQFLRAIDAGLAVRPVDRPQSVEAFRALLGLGDRRLRPRPAMPTLAPDSPAHGIPPQAESAAAQPEPRFVEAGAENSGRIEPMIGDAGQSAAADAVLDSRTLPRHVAVTERDSAPVIVFLVSGIALAAALGAAAWYWLLRPKPADISPREGPLATTKPIGPPAVLQPLPPAKPAEPPPPSSASDAPPSPALPPPGRTTEVPAEQPAAQPQALPEPPKAPRRTLAPAELFDEVLARAIPQRGVTALPETRHVESGTGIVRFAVSSTTSGYLYVLRHGPAADEVQLVFPNLADQKNRITAGKPVVLPGAAWAKPIAGGTGNERYLVMVSEEPRDFGLIDARTRGQFKLFRPDSLRGLQHGYGGEEPLLAGIAVCPAGVPCSTEYGATGFTIERVAATPGPLPKPAAQEIVRQARTQVENEPRASHTRTTEASTPRRPVPASRCSDILERGSLGETLTAEQMAYLKKECGQ